MPLSSAASPMARSSRSSSGGSSNNATTPKAPCSNERSRRPHHKSRTGCHGCKARRVKCDEKRPVCSGCSKKNMECHYFHPVCSLNEPSGRVKIDPIRRALPEKRLLSLPNLSRHDTQESPSPPSFTSASTNSEPLPPQIGTPSDRLLELRLFHHYHRMTGQSSHGQQAWSKWIANLAVATPSVMDAVLGFSAFHLRRLGENNREMRQASHAYMALAIRSHKEQIATGFNHDNAAALVACGALILFHMTVNQSYISSTSHHQLPLHWLRPFHRAACYFGTTWHQIEQSPIGKVLKHFISSPLPPPEKATKVLPFQDFGFLLQGIELESLDAATVAAYENAVHLLTEIYMLGYQRPLRFPTMVTPLFADLVEAREPRALAVLGYFFMLVKIAKVLWWVDGSAEREFSALMTFMPRDWWPVMDSAIQEFDWKEDSSVVVC